MSRFLALVALAGLCLGIATGCYYFDESYKTADNRYGKSVWDDGDSVVQYPKKKNPAPAPGEAVPEQEDEVVDVTDPGEGPPKAPPAGTPPTASPAESIGKFEVQLRLLGVTPQTKGALEKKLKSLASVEYVDTLFYQNGELRLGVRLKKPLDVFVDDMQGLTGFPVDLLGTTTLILGRVRAATGLKVKIFGPSDGAVLSTAKVWVGVAVSGGTPASVSVNGVSAVQMPGQGRYKALVACRAGKNSIVAVVRDRAGSVAEDRITISVGGEAAPQPPGRTVLVQGKIDDPMGSVMVDGKPVKVDDKGRYRVKVTVANGTKFVTVIETDSLGNRTIRRIGVE